MGNLYSHSAGLIQNVPVKKNKEKEARRARWRRSVWPCFCVCLRSCSCVTLQYEARPFRQYVFGSGIAISGRSASVPEPVNGMRLV